MIVKLNYHVIKSNDSHIYLRKYCIGGGNLLQNSYNNFDKQYYLIFNQWLMIDICLTFKLGKGYLKIDK